MNLNHLSPSVGMLLDKTILLKVSWSTQKRIVQYCGGLPLALQVLGSSLSGRSIDVRESTLRKLELIPKSQIVKKLKISYDSLQDDHDKNLFLYIACFFFEKDKDFSVRILDECDFCTTVGIQNLIDRCLITIDKNNKMMMHQLLQDMGREIICQESPKEPGKRSRLWHHKDSFNVLREKTGTETIKGLVLDMHMLREVTSSKSVLSANISNQHHCKEVFSLNQHHFGFLSCHPAATELKNANEAYFKTNALARMHKLRLLHLNYVQLNGSYRELPKGLRWLCWQGFRSKFIPEDFALESLVVLDMRYSSLERVWKRTKFLGLLKFLNLSHSHGLVKTPDFSQLPNLERLILKDCTSLFRIHESIGNLESLVLLNVKDCKKLRTLPRNIAMLKSLEKLIVSSCSKLDTLPPNMGEMESLKALHVDGTPLNQLLSTTGEVKPWHALVWPLVSKPRTPKISRVFLPRFLVNLSLMDCNLSDDDFSRDFSNLLLLQNLNLSKNPISSLPDWIRGLTRLQTLHLNSCTRLKSFLGLPSVELLLVGHSTSLEKITYQSNMFSSQLLEHTECRRLVEIQGVFKLLPLGMVETEMIQILGLINLESLANIEVFFMNGWNMGKCPIQGLYELDFVFSTFFPGKEVPFQFCYRSTASSIAFTVPSLDDLTIRGLNICLVYESGVGQDNCSLSHKKNRQPILYVEISTENEALNQDMISHWSIGNQLKRGDEVNVSVTVRTLFKLKEYGVHVVYEKE